jgi:molecular chaperone IbpA
LKTDIDAFGVNLKLNSLILGENKMNVGRIAFSPYTQNALGFENLFADMDRFLSSDTAKTSGYPPHNLIKVDGDKYIVEIAASGFALNELEVSVKDSYLIVKGEKQPKDDEQTVHYIYKGIGARSFVKSFKIADTITITGAAFKDGILSVALLNVIPEQMKERKIEIGTNISGFNQQLLTEADKVK